MFGRNRARHAAALLTWAADHDFSYLARDGALASAPWLASLGSRSGRATSHVLRGSYRGHPVLLLTLSSKVSTPGPDGTTQVDKREQGVDAIQLPSAISRIKVRPKYSVGDIARTVRERDDAVARKDFDGAYEVQADDAQLAARVLHPQLRAWLLDTNAPGFTIVGDRLLYVGARMDADRIEYRLDYLCALSDLIAPQPWNVPRAGPA